MWILLHDVLLSSRGKKRDKTGEALSQEEIIQDKNAIRATHHREGGEVHEDISNKVQHV